jgi:hypothetical protein
MAHHEVRNQSPSTGIARFSFISDQGGAGASHPGVPKALFLRRFVRPAKHSWMPLGPGRNDAES